MSSVHVTALIVAAGRGTRMNMDVNKQYIEVEGIPVLARTLRVFEQCESINDVVVIVNQDDMDYCQENIINKFGFNKVKRLVPGGKERQNSVYNGLCAVNDAGIVLIHDGARPFLSKEHIENCIVEVNKSGAAIVAVPVKDTIKSVDSEGFIDKTLDRSCLWSVQTPQGFKYDIILDAHKKALKEGFFGTDDASLVERLGMKVKIVMGSYNNIKITTKEDLALAETIIRSKTLE